MIFTQDIQLTLGVASGGSSGRKLGDTTLEAGRKMVLATQLAGEYCLIYVWNATVNTVLGNVPQVPEHVKFLPGIERADREALLDASR